MSGIIGEILGVERSGSPKSVGIIGSGVGGLGAAWLLDPHTEVTVFERDSWVGGHGHSPEVEISGKNYRFDLGVQFISTAVYRNIYAALQRPQFKSAPVTASPVTTYSVSTGPKGERWLWGNTPEYQSQPRVMRSVWDDDMIEQANRFMLEMQYMSQEEQLETLGPWLKKNNFSDKFADACCQPLLSILNVTRNGLLKTNLILLSRLIPGLLSFVNGTTWFRFTHQVKSFIDALSQPFAKRIHVNQTVLGCWPGDNDTVNVEVKDQKTGETKLYNFDEVIYNGTLSFARDILDNRQNPNWATQTKFLAPFGGERSNCYLHQDPNYMPGGVPFDSATLWNAESESPRMSYNQTVIRGLQDELNPGVWMSYGEPGDAPGHQLIEPVVWDHPTDSSTIFGAKRQLHKIQGLGGIWYCGGNTTLDAFNPAFVSGMIIAQKICNSVAYPFTDETPIDRAAQVDFTEYKLGYMFPSSELKSEFAKIAAEHLPTWLKVAAQRY